MSARAMLRTSGALALAAVACGGDPYGEVVESHDQAFSTLCGTSSAPIRGIDVAKYEGDVSWAGVKAEGIDFGFARTTNGTAILDEWFESNWREMRDAGVVRGAYQYFRPGQDPIAQAEAMLSMIDAAGGLLADDLPPVLDLETDDGLPMSAVTTKAQTWLTHVEARTGKRPLVYSAAYFGDGTQGALAGYPLWVANYVSTPVGKCPKVPNGWTRWHFWQWSETGRLGGVPADAVDLDVFDGSLDDLRAFVADSNVGAGGAGGQPGSGGAAGSGGAPGSGGTPGSGGLAGTGGAGGDGAAAGAGASGGAAAAAGQGPGGPTGAGAGPGSGCSRSPDCGGCESCLDVCLCHGGDFPGCVSACAPSGDEPEEPGAGDAGDASSESGCAMAGASAASPVSPGAWLGIALGLAFTVSRRRARRRERPVTVGHRPDET